MEAGEATVERGDRRRSAVTQPTYGPDLELGANGAGLRPTRSGAIPTMPGEMVSERDACKRDLPP